MSRAACTAKMDAVCLRMLKHAGKIIVRYGGLSGISQLFHLLPFPQLITWWDGETDLLHCPSPDRGMNTTFILGRKRGVWGKEGLHADRTPKSGHSPASLIKHHLLQFLPIR